MSAYPGGDLGEAAHSVPRELLQHARRRAWLDQLKRAGLPIDETPVATALRVDSVERTNGDPQLLSVRERDEDACWRVDRRTLRINHEPRVSHLSAQQVQQVADLADRAQLELGRPITLSWVASETGAASIVDVEPLSPRVQFTNQSYRRIAPLRAEPGTLSPLAVDLLDRALKEEGGDGVVRRIYGRAYRGHGSLQVALNGAEGRWKRAALQARDALRDLALLGNDALRSERELSEACQRLDRMSLEALDTEDLLQTLDERIRLVLERLRLLERSRQTTLLLLPVLMRVTGPVPRDLLASLAELVPTPERVAINDRLIALGHLLQQECGAIDVPGPDAPDKVRHAFARAAKTLRRERSLGMDVRPAAFDESADALLDGVREARSKLEVAPQQRRREAERELLDLAAARGPMRGGAPAARVALLWLKRIAIAKGQVAEGLSHALLRLRAAVLEAGERLAVEGVIDDAEDAFYLEVEELVHALRGEIGAYAARSRFRREDDQRWRNFNAPHRIYGRRS